MIVHKILELPEQAFLPIWASLTVAFALIAPWLVGRGKVRLQRGDQASAKVAAGLWPAPRSGAWPILGVFGLIVMGYIALIFAWEDFAYYDDSQFTQYTLKGHSFRPPIWNSGRFFPLDMQEFNLIRYLTHTAAGYHVLPALQLLGVCALLLVLDREIDLIARVGLAVCVLFSPGMIISFTGLIYPERNVIFWLLCLIFFVDRFDRTQSSAAAVAAVVSAQFMLYYKETAFLLLWGFVAGRLLLRCRNIGRPGWNFGRLSEKASCLDFCLAVLGFIFVCYYGLVMHRHTSLQYAQHEKLPELEVLLSYLKADLLVWLFVPVVVIRFFLIFKSKIVPSPFWESLAWGALAYVAAFLVLGMFRGYYLAPADVIAILYLGRLACLSWGKASLSIRMAGSLLLCAILLQNILSSTYRMYERKNLIRAKVEIANRIQEQYRRNAGIPLRLYFPFSSPYLTMEFGAYLDYRGLPIEEAGTEPGGTNSVELVCHAMTNDGLIQNYRNIIGHAGRTPMPGDLVIILPDDDVSSVEASPYLYGGDSIFSYSPRPSLPGWFDFLARHLHFTYVNSFSIPDRWLNASVLLWKMKSE
ncbi:MAG TPA: hypothetical protein VGJ73_20965 [Verrucomicrobiae bacterium]|jgi:hypothetical protein